MNHPGHPGLHGSSRKPKALGLLWLAVLGCGFDRSDRWIDPPAPAATACEEGQQRCRGQLQRCEVGPDGAAWVDHEDCAGQGLVCAPALLACVACIPGERRCDRQTVVECDPAGAQLSPVQTCDGEGQACRNGVCQHLCSQASEVRSNVGCEYWAVDLDNTNISNRFNAAAQQFAVVVSNPQPDVAAEVRVSRDDTQPGAAGAPIVVASALLPSLSLRVFKLGPREVDGSAPGTYNTGTHTALTRTAYRITSSVPIIAYQFNPLENLNVFSNDASLLKPVEALIVEPGALTDAYVVLGWPQTIAQTEDPETNFSAANPVSLRAFLTIVGTRPETRVRLTSTARIVGTDAQEADRELPSHRQIAETPVGGELEAELDAFDVLNLETDDFNADFTGSVVAASQPVVVFSGVEASDAPYYQTLASRLCCADHLEEQLDPIRTAGREFVATVSPNRTAAVNAAGASLGLVPQPEFFRLIAATSAGARVKTTLEDPARIELEELGSFVDITSTEHFMLKSDQPVMLGSVSPSQDAAGIPRGLPGGDPSFIVVPPVEQYRRSYVFLTPDKYCFDFVRIIASPNSTIVFDNQPLQNVVGCTSAPADGLDADQRGNAQRPFLVHTCQLSFPTIGEGEPTGLESDCGGTQNDGVHRIESDTPIGVLVNGFDSYVSYGYAAGTELEQIVIR